MAEQGLKTRSPDSQPSALHRTGGMYQRPPGPKFSPPTLCTLCRRPACSAGSWACKGSVWSLPAGELRSVFYLFIWIFKLEFIGVMLVHNTIQVLSAQLHKTTSAPCIVCPAPKAKSFCPHESPSAHLHLRPQLSEAQPSSLPSDSCQSVSCIQASVAMLFVSLFCSGDSSDKRDLTQLLARLACPG